MRTPTTLYPPLTQLQPLRPAPHRRPVRRAESRAVAPAGPPRYKLALLTWVAAYPIITVILGLLGPELATRPPHARGQRADGGDADLARDAGPDPRSTPVAQAGVTPP